MPQDERTPEASAPLLGDDQRVAQLAKVLGGDVDASRAKAIAVGVIVVGIIGAVGSALRPIIMRRYASTNKAISTAGGLGKGRIGTRTAEEARRAMAAEAAVARAREAAEADEEGGETTSSVDAVTSTRSGGVGAALTPTARYAPLFEKAGLAAPRPGYVMPAPLVAALDALAAEEEQLRLLSMLHELSEYEAYHRARHPLWYGAVTPGLVAEVEADFRAQFDQEAAEGIFAGKAGGLPGAELLSATSPFLPPEGDAAASSSDKKKLE